MRLSPTKLRQKRILVVEDDPDVREVLVDLLQSLGAVVDTAEDGYTALQQLRRAQAQTDLIILDLMMPILDGYGFRKQQEEDYRIAAIPILLLSADGCIEEKRLKIGAREYVAKPVELSVLTQAVERCVQ